MACYPQIYTMPICQICHDEIGDTLLEKENQVIR